MKKLLLLLSPLLLTGCLAYGNGEHKAYVYAVDKEMFSTSVWVKTDLAASQGYCYRVDDPAVIQKLKEFNGEGKVTLTYDKHLITIVGCNSEIVTGVTDSSVPREE